MITPETQSTVWTLDRLNRQVITSYARLSTTLQQGWENGTRKNSNTNATTTVKTC
jgi:hypothetical protein